MDNSVYYIWLSLAVGVGSPDYSTLFSRYPDIKSIYDEEDFSTVDHISASHVSKLEDKDLTRAMEIAAVCKSKGIGIVCYHDELYPARLRVISSPPPLLYYKGNLRDFSAECLIAVVGTRNMTEYGAGITRSFARAFASAGAVVVSGLAAGVDGAAHRGCLEENGFTVAVLGTGIDKPYPRENEELYYEIAQKGLVISEYYPGSPVHGSNFPIRNRIISGISSATVVTEAGEKSGALITARLAVMQGRDVYALPGITGSEQSVGTNMLLQKGVNLAYRPADVLSKLELVYPAKIKIPDSAYRMPEVRAPRQPKSPAAASAVPAGAGTGVNTVRLNSNIGKLEPEERLIVDCLSGGAKHPDSVVAATGLDAGDVMSALTVLEIYGVVAEDASGKYYLK